MKCIKSSIVFFPKLTTLGLCLWCSFAFGQEPQGFFLNDFTPRQALIPPSIAALVPSAAPTVTVTVNANDTIARITKYLYGHNANVYMTQMVDQPVLLDYIERLSPNVIRFPGGNLSSVFFWNAEKDQPPPDAPAQLLDANGNSIPPGYWYGKNTEGWTLSVDNYYEMLAQTGNTGMITINYAYARYSTADDPVASAAHLAADWVRYDNGRTKFWEIGNESNGTWQAGFRIKTADNKDNQPEIISGSLYGQHFKVFADSMRKAAGEKGVQIFIGAQLLAEAPASWWNNTDKNWNNGIFQQAGNSPDFYIIHSYYTPYATNSTASSILATATQVTEDMMEFVTNSQQQAGVTRKPVALTEWNIFAEGSKQQASYINGMHGTMVLGELIRNGYGLACRWDLANGWNNGNDHGILNNGDEPGGIPRWNPRAPYYYMAYFQKYFGDVMLESSVTGSDHVRAYASRFGSGEAGIVVVNTGTQDEIVAVEIPGYGYGDNFYVYSLSGGTDNGEFSLKVFINGVGPTYATGGPVNFESIPAKAFALGTGIKVACPARSVQYILAEAGQNIITDTGDEVSFEYFPNPSGRTVKLRSHCAAGAFRIHDTTGRSIFHQMIEHGLEAEVSLPGPGIYFLIFECGEDRRVHKIVVDENHNK